MLGRRRPPPQVIFAFSLLLAALAGFAAYRYGMAENWVPTALWGAIALWLLVDAFRAFGWMKNGRNLPPEPSQAPRPAPQPSVTNAVNVNPEVTGAPTNPLLQRGEGQPPQQTPTDRLD